MKALFLILILFSLRSQALVTEWSSSLPKKNNFIITPDLNDRVMFWKKIYSEVSENEGLFHDPDTPEIIYGKVNWENIKNNSNLTGLEKTARINSLIKSSRQKLMVRWKIKNPDQIRLQTGLKERMQKALFESGKYLPMMEDVFKDHNLPIELTRIVFVESSFNILAQSKVGASGLWQIMPSVAREEGYIHKYYDNRNHPYYATELAADILQQNKRSLKSWPLAITAYNHGVSGVKKMVRLNKTQYLPNLVTSDNTTRSWGFASANFYACFLAVLQVERSAKSLYGDNLLKSKPLNANRVTTVASISKQKMLSYFDHSLIKMKKMNPHINMTQFRKTQKIPVGIPLIMPKKIKDKAFRTAAI